MKPSLELLELSSSQKSFNFFKVDVNCFEPFWHYHPELELTLITKGQGTRFVGDSISPFYDLDLVLVGEGLPHHWVSFENSEQTLQQAFVFQFPKDMFDGIKECKPLQELFEVGKRGIQFTDPSPEVIHAIQTFANRSQIEQVATLMSILSMLQTDPNKIWLSTTVPSNNIRHQNQTKINETISYILEHLNHKLTVQMLSDRTAMVPQSFCRWFKNETGNSFVTFLNRSRIEQACQLLLSTDLPIQQIAFDCGFESLSHFNRTFKSLKNTSPRSYKSNQLLDTK